VASTKAKLEQRIRERAYRIWLEEGQPEGRANEHWRLAEFAVAKQDGLPSNPSMSSRTGPNFRR